jgi:TonB family protein
LLLVACLSGDAHTTVDTTNPSVIHAPIQYPSSAVSTGEEGTVLVKAEVNASGRAVGAKIDKSSGHPNLDAAALQSISRWSFLPGTKDGKPVAQRVVVPIRFQLQHETTGVSGLPETSLAIASFLLISLGSPIWAIGFVWSIVLAKRNSILWLSGMVALWIVTYPIFVAMHWSAAKRNLVVVSLGIVLFCLGLYLAPSRHLST